MGTPRRRLDRELDARGLAPSRSAAQELIRAGRVLVDGAVARKPATLVAAAQSVTVRTTDTHPYVSRGGVKLAGALDELGVDPAGRHALDAGASTGGFTDVLLRRGAVRVVAVDVGYGQLAWRLRTDPRVHVRERTNVRHLTADALPPPPPDLVVADLAFISLAKVVGVLAALAAADAEHVLLVKPQFEVGPRLVGRGGVVRDPAAWRAALDAVAAAGARAGLQAVAAVASPLPGPSGNVEFFLHLRRGGDAAAGTALRALLDVAVRRGEALAGRHQRA